MSFTVPYNNQQRFRTSARVIPRPCLRCLSLNSKPDEISPHLCQRCAQNLREAARMFERSN